MLRKLSLLVLVSCLPAVLRATEATPAKDTTAPAAAPAATPAAAAAPSAAPEGGRCDGIRIPNDLGPPSNEARLMPGALGTFPFTPPPPRPGTTHWKDTDGILPGTPGCHIPTDPGDNRMFGEACGLYRNVCVLVETNPRRNVVHSHPHDTGKPDVFNCAQWCIGTGHPNGGTCEPAPALDDRCHSIASAYCKCN